MPLTDEINKSLGELQNEIKKLRDGELIKSIKPFVEKTSELVSKLDSMNLATKHDIVESNNKLVDEIEKTRQKIDFVESEQNKKLKNHGILLILIFVFTVVAIGINFMK